MRSIVVTACLLVAFVVATRAQGPVAGPEHKRMAYYVGNWTFTGEVIAGPMGPGGPATMKETCELMEGGFALVCRAEGKLPAGPTRSVSIMTYDPAKKAYTYTAAENNMPVFTATGHVKGPVWTWTVSTDMGGKTMTTRVTSKEASPTAYDFTMEAAFDKGAFAQFLSGKWTKTK